MSPNSSVLVISLQEGQVGSIIGLFLNGIISERFGYRKTMIFTMIALIGTIFIPFFSTSLEMYLAGGVLQGIPWGVFQVSEFHPRVAACSGKLPKVL